MASTNQSPQYQKAETKFLNSKTDKERLRYLDEMIRECPKHKSAEKMLANLRTRKRKLLEKLESIKKTGRGRINKGIKKEEMQAVIVGFSNTGKSSLISILTNTNPLISENRFSTKEPLVGMMPYLGMNIQIVDMPSIESEFFDKGIVNNADVVLLIVNDLRQIKEINEKTKEILGRKIIVFNDFNILDENEKRKISSNLQSNKYNYVIVSTKTREGIEKLKEKIFDGFGKIRVFTKEPKKALSERSNKPIILEENSMVLDVAEKILHGFSKKVKEAKIWGPSSKFPGQIVGLKHILKDMDTVEFKTR